MGAKYARQPLLLSNLIKADDESISQQNLRIDVRKTVSSKFKLSGESYSKGKKVFELIFQLQEFGKLKAAAALEKEFNRSIDAAYKFVCNEDIYNQVIDRIEAGEIGSVGDGIAWVLCGDRNIHRLLDSISLSSDHREELRNRGLSDKLIDAGFFRSIERWQQLSCKVSHRVPGVSLSGRSLTNWTSGYICPLWNPKGEIISWQLRTDGQEKNLQEQTDKEIPKYLWATSSLASQRKLGEIGGYKRPIFLRASVILKRQFTLAFLELRSLCQEAISEDNF
ncbi:hypothetical protein NIES4075_66080 [Tolypothrix sp. NIES-4075]|uniref:hypothetical protein n=1 Tax=Tolypothrix sp. NIES-4075 TaxID=2005459 RepID=UPI000B62373E|nr:hypothetical protein [Tolypothrix sp. NIES-4075]GAX45587.1 hypothetical protein NIES4075_66080 [Tolypothrix sp. NIES-4075]